MQPALGQASTIEPTMAPATETASCAVEVTLPLRVSHKWVAYACRTAGISKPRWNRVRSMWTSDAIGEAGAPETIAITSTNRGMGIRVVAEWQAAPDDSHETATVRRLATAFVTTMRDAMRRRSMLRDSIAELSRRALS